MSISSISKHVDFVAIDMVSLAAAFACAYLLKFGNLEFINVPSWRGLLAFLLLSDLLFTLLTNLTAASSGAATGKTSASSWYSFWRVS